MLLVMAAFCVVLHAGAMAAAEGAQWTNVEDSYLPNQPSNTTVRLEAKVTVTDSLILRFNNVLQCRVH